MLILHVCVTNCLYSVLIRDLILLCNAVMYFLSVNEYYEYYHISLHKMDHKCSSFFFIQGTSLVYFDLFGYKIYNIIMQVLQLALTFLPWNN